MKRLTELQEWRALQSHKQAIAADNMQTWFAEDPQRFERFSLHVGDILLDYSKNRITPETLELLGNLANAIDLSGKIKGLFSGHPLNSTEQRPALHTALRNPSHYPLYVNNQDIMTEIHGTLNKMREFTDKVRKLEWLGATGKPIRDIVNIGIGGSHLGPQMATHALSDFAIDSLHCHFISNIDSSHLIRFFKKSTLKQHYLLFLQNLLPP